MIEIPEAFVLCRQIKEHTVGKAVSRVLAASSPHKFAWYQDDPRQYPQLLEGRKITSARPVGGMVEISLDGILIVLSEGAYPRLIRSGEKLPAKHQLLLEFTDGSALSVSVRMYGGILAFPIGGGDNPYYLAADDKPSPLTEAFDRSYFDALINQPEVEKLSAKAFLATEQRIPGLGNGVLQDILYLAGVHPKRKLSGLDKHHRNAIFHSVKSTLTNMAEEGGRDTEKDLLGNPGGYKTRCSKNTVGQPCSLCGTLIKKGSFMGGSIYFCPICQPL